MRCKTCNKGLALVARKGTIIICWRCKTENIAEEDTIINDKVSKHVDNLDYMN